MSGLGFEPWEPEESVGKVWHAFASRLDAPESFEDAAVALEEVGGRLAVFFRGLGGAPSVEIRPAAAAPSHHRVSWRRRLASVQERGARASFDGHILRLPPRIAAFPDRAANAALYLWLAACAAHAPDFTDDPDPLRADLRTIRAAAAMTQAVLAVAPGLRGLHEGLAHVARLARAGSSLPAEEAAVEAVILHLLGGPEPSTERGRQFVEVVSGAGDLEGLAAPRRYRPFRPVPLWPDLGRGPSGDIAPGEEEPEPGQSAEASPGVHRARRRKTDLAERRDSLILHKFEAILSWTDFLNLNRRVDDDDPDTARKAAEDLDEISLGQITKAPATRLKLHLDLSPQDAERERLSGTHLYPEWDHRAGSYLADHCRVLASVADPATEPPERDQASLRRIRAVRRRFEALRPHRVTLPKQTDGDDLDLDEAVRSAIDLRAAGQGSDRIWRASRNEARDLAVSILLDASRSTESAVTGRAVIDIEREALTALAWGLRATGDDCAINAFSSLKRNRVYVQTCKGFEEPMGATVEARIAGLRPGFYTRLGAAVRHVSAELADRARQRRLLIVITDGKPNDLDHYEGQHGIEDSRMAMREARRAGQAVFGIAVDAQAQSWFSRIFGRGGFAVIAHPDRLTEALPGIYRHLVGA